MQSAKLEEEEGTDYLMYRWLNFYHQFIISLKAIKSIKIFSIKMINFYNKTIQNKLKISKEFQQSSIFGQN